jgi:HAD superfamily hydrolase (TIGR01484 family)
MRYLALAADYDGTLAHNGAIDHDAVNALERLRATGRRIILVTGRTLDDLARVCPYLGLFDRIVAENGSLLYRPDNKAETILGERPPDKFIEVLQQRGVAPLSVGQVIVATWTPNENVVLDTIRDLGLELHVVFNKGAVMVLPSGVNKASGLHAALDDLGLSPHNVVGIGDAENDHAFMQLCECSFAVANALAMVKERADGITQKDHGAGVAELVERLVASDLREMESRLDRHEIALGVREDAQELRLKPYGVNVLLAGSSHGGKTTLAMGVVERLLDHRYQLCILDPEGDYSNLQQIVYLGDPDQKPTFEEVASLLSTPEQSAVVNLLAVRMEDRPAFFDQLLQRIQRMRSKVGHPHWLIVDEAHHLIPALLNSTPVALPEEVTSLMMITMKPAHLSAAVLKRVDVIIAIGETPERTLQEFADIVGTHLPPFDAHPLQQGEGVFWAPCDGAPPLRFHSLLTRTERHRHVRKYAAGEIPSEHSFYFTGREHKLCLRAQNLRLFLQIGEGVDEETWLYHLHRGDYENWFRSIIRDSGLANAAASIALRPGLTAQDGRALIRAAIERSYSASA